MELPRLILLQGGRSAEKPVAEKPVEAKEPGDTTIYRADYRSFWRLPPPRRLPSGSLFVLAGVVLGAVMFAVGD